VAWSGEEHEADSQLTRRKNNRHRRRPGSSKKWTSHRQTKNQGAKCTLSYERENLASKEKSMGAGYQSLDAHRKEITTQKSAEQKYLSD
jgi:hypothetical protein